jgi:hypothetical protein
LPVELPGLEDVHEPGFVCTLHDEFAEERTAAGQGGSYLWSLTPGVVTAHSGGRRSRAERGLHLMTSRRRKSHSASRPHSGALARWETEGGALGSAGRGRDGRVPSPSKRRISCSALGRRCSCNGTICRPMFRGSSSSIPSPASNHVRSLLKEQIARFLHKHKDDNRHRK